MNSKEQIEALKKLGRSKGSIAAAIGVTPQRFSVVLNSSDKQFSKLQAEKIDEIYKREIENR